MSTDNHRARFRNICITINNFTEDDRKLIFDKINDGTIKYYIEGLEVGGNHQIPHIQGYMELSKQIGIKTIKAFLPRAHIEKRKGSQEQAIDYCKKDGIWQEWGERNQQGNRSDLDVVREMIKQGKTLKEISDVVTSYQALRFAEKYIQLHEPKRSWKPKVTWIYGVSGSGKTYWAKKLAGPNRWVSNKTLEWWQNYEGQENIVIDEFRAHYCPFTELLRILDEDEYSVMIKGGSRQLLAKNIYITSNRHPTEIYGQLSEEQVHQLTRRIDKIVYFDKVYESVKYEPETISQDDFIKSCISNDDQTLVDSKVGGNTIPLPLDPPDLAPSADIESTPVNNNSEIMSYEKMKKLLKNKTEENKELNYLQNKINNYHNEFLKEYYLKKETEKTLCENKCGNQKFSNLNICLSCYKEKCHKEALEYQYFERNCEICDINFKRDSKDTYRMSLCDKCREEESSDSY